MSSARWSAIRAAGFSAEGGALLVAADALVLAALGIAAVVVSRLVRGSSRGRTRLGDRRRPVLWAVGALARWTLGLALIALGVTWGVFGFGPALLLVGVGVMVIAFPRCVGGWRPDYGIGGVDLSVDPEGPDRRKP